MKKTMSTLAVGLTLTTSAFAFPIEIDSKAAYGVQMPAFGQTDSQVVMFKDKSKGSESTYFKVDVKPSFTTNRFNGKITEQCNPTSCNPVTGWIVDPNDNIYGIKVDEPTIRKGAILAASMMNGINSKLKDNNVSTEMQKFYDKLQREMVPTMTLKADTSVKLIVDYDINSTFGFCNTMKHQFGGMYDTAHDTLNLISPSHYDSCFNHSPKEMSELITTSDIYFLLMAYKAVAGDKAYSELVVKAMDNDARTSEQIKKIAESMPKASQPTKDKAEK